MGARGWIRRVVLVSISVAAVGGFAGDDISGTDVFDIIIANGRVLDGSGNPFFYADVGIRGDTIVTVGDLTGTTASRLIDASGQYITPVFFALHEHIDRAILGGHGRVPNYTTQGFTTAVINMDGRNLVWPVAELKRELTEVGSALNLVTMVGHGTIRSLVMGEKSGDTMRRATGDEVERMKQLVRQGMEDGAFGLSTGLEYAPMRYSSEQEVLELAEAVAPYGGHFQAHMRSQGRYPKWQIPSHMDHPTQRHVDWMDAVMEVLEIARRTGIPAMIDHIHPKGPREWGMSRVTTQLFDEAWSKGHQIYINMHSYEGYSAYVTLIPRWALVVGEVQGLSQADNTPAGDYTGMLENLRERLENAELAKLIRSDIEYEILRQGGAANLVVIDFTDEKYVGLALAEVANLRDEDPVDTAIWMQFHGLDQPGRVLWMAKAVGLVDIEQWMRQDYTGVCLDRGGDTGDRRSKSTHPGAYGTSGRLIREVVFERRTITLPHAIRSLTSLGAQILGLRDRGRIAAGQKADVVVFDPETIGTDATYLEPYVEQRGMNFVLINGHFVVDEGRPTSAVPGRVLERQRTSSRSVIAARRR